MLAASVQRATPANADDFLRFTAQSAGFHDIELTMLEHGVDIADFTPWFLAQTGGTPWGPTLARLTDAGRQELAAMMADRLVSYAAPEGGHRLPFRSYRLRAPGPGEPIKRVAAPKRTTRRGFRRNHPPTSRRSRQLSYRDGVGDVARGQLLDVVAGRDTAGSCRWLAGRPVEWRDRILAAPVMTAVLPLRSCIHLGARRPRPERRSR